MSTYVCVRSVPHMWERDNFTDRVATHNGTLHQACSQFQQGAQYTSCSIVPGNSQAQCPTSVINGVANALEPCQILSRSLLSMIFNEIVKAIINRNMYQDHEQQALCGLFLSRG